MSEMQPLQLEDRDRVERCFDRHPPAISEHTFTNLFMWQDSRTILWTDTGDSQVFAGKREEGLVLFGPPAGPISVAEALGVLQEAGAGPILAAERIPESCLEGLRSESLEPRADRDNYDYVYSQEDLAELPGRHLHSKRNMVERCLSSHECRWEPITPDILGEVRELQDRWCEERNCGKNPGLCAEYQAIRQVLEHFADLSVRGGAVRVDGRLEAYTIGEGLNQQTAVVHVEKAMPGIEGLYQVVNQWFCREQLGEFEFVNREQDLGIRGIRKAKKSYQPDHMVRKYWIKLGPSYARPEAREGRCD